MIIDTTLSTKENTINKAACRNLAFDREHFFPRGTCKNKAEKLELRDLYVQDFLEKKGFDFNNLTRFQRRQYLRCNIVFWKNGEVVDVLLF